MATSRRYSDGRRRGKANFVQTCNLLGRYVKKKGGARNLNIEIDGQVKSFESVVKSLSTSATMNLPTHMDNSAPVSMDSFPKKQDWFMNKVENTLAKAATSNDAMKVEPKTAPLTIFYAGRVFVFDDYPDDKAKELVSFAETGSNQRWCGIFSNILEEKRLLEDMPIARRSSLHRFLEKTKDRGAGRGSFPKGDEQLELKL